jgi:hypothetical protein
VFQNKQKKSPLSTGEGVGGEAIDAPRSTAYKLGLAKTTAESRSLIRSLGQRAARLNRFALAGCQPEKVSGIEGGPVFRGVLAAVYFVGLAKEVFEVAKHERFAGHRVK